MEIIKRPLSEYTPRVIVPRIEIDSKIYELVETYISKLGYDKTYTRNQRNHVYKIVAGHLSFLYLSYEEIYYCEVMFYKDIIIYLDEIFHKIKYKDK